MHGGSPEILGWNVGVLLVKQQRKAKMATQPYSSKKFYCERDKYKSSSYPDDTNPTEVTDSHCLMKFPPNGRLEDVTDRNTANCYGKWKVFRPRSLLDKTWHIIRKEVMAGNLAALAVGVRCTTCTSYYNPSSVGFGPVTEGFISVFTTKEKVDKAGEVLIRLVKDTIHYKTQEASKKPYSHGSTYEKQLTWKGEPPSQDLDKWPLNCVTTSPFEEYGYWAIVSQENWDFPCLWHLLKEKMETRELGIVRMVSPKPKAHKNPEYRMFTSYDNRESVGRKLMYILNAQDLRRDLNLELRYKISLEVSGVHLYKHIIKWNNGEPEYHMILIQ